MSGKSIIGALHVAFSADTAELSKGLDSVKAKLGGLAKVAGFTGAAIGAGLAAAAVGLSAAVKGSIDAADQMDEMAQKVGVGVEGLSRLKYAAEISGVSMDTLSTGLKRLSAGMMEAATTGTGKAAGALARLGVEVRDASGALRDSDAVLVDVAERFSIMQDGANKTALAMSLFGKSGADMIPFLNEGADGIARLRAEADDLGITLSAEAAASAGKFNENLDRLKAVGGGLTNQLATALLPALEGITNGLVVVAKNADLVKGIGQALGFTLKLLASAAIGVASQFAVMGRNIATTGTIITRVLKGDFGGAAQAYRDGVTKNMQGLATAADSIRAIWTKTAGDVKRDAPGLSDDLAKPAVDGAKKVKAARQSLETEAEKMARAIREFIAAEQSSMTNAGLSENERRARQAIVKAHEAYLAGLYDEAKVLGELAKAYRDGDVQLQKLDDRQVQFIKNLNEHAPQFEQTWDDFVNKVLEAENAFRQSEYAVEDLISGIRNGDWFGAFSGLIRALDGVKRAFAESGNAASRFAAVAGLASAAGSAIGGKVGGALSGAASGAAAGATFGPVGAVVGGILGGLGGLFGASKAKKRAKAQAKAEAERRAAELAAAKRALEIQLMELAGDATGALTARRAEELKALDASLHGLQEEIWARQDAADAAAKAAEMVAQRTALERELLRLHDADAALAADRADALAALDPALRGLQQTIYDVIDATAAAEAAQQQLAEIEAAAADRRSDAEDRLSRARDDAAEAAEREISALEDVRDRFADIADELAAFRKDLRAQTLAGDPRRELIVARAAFMQLEGRTDAESLAKLPELGRALLAAEAKAAPNARALAQATSRVMQAVNAGEVAARSQVSVAEQQIAALTSTATALGLFNLNVMTFAEAQERLGRAIVDQADVMRETGAQIEAASSAVAAALATVAAAVNTNAPPALIPPPIDAALTATLAGAATALGGGLELQDPGGLGAAIAGGLAPYFEQIVVNTGGTFRLLDDATQGGDALRTVAA
ncbi:hypothetical protein [Phenylobacterium sp.]|uniref:hypothetical protein n=1 Tax=Phenylobacterium sp. TaxID=1871053 RepID=UPI00301DD7D9